MFITNLARFGAVVVIVIGNDMANSHNTWAWWVGSVIFVIGLQLFTEATLLWDRRRKMPYRWNCQICKRKGKPTGVEASEEFLLQGFRDDHNRKVHLLEP